MTPRRAWGGVWLLLVAAAWLGCTAVMAAGSFGWRPVLGFIGCTAVVLVPLGWAARRSHQRDL